MGGTDGIEGAIARMLAAAGLPRSVLPVRVPCAVLWPTACALAPPLLDHSLQQVLAAVRRRVVYRRLVVATQVLGVVGAWAGVVLDKGRALTLIGVGVALVGVAFTLIDKDRLTALDGRIERALDEHRAACLEWLLMALEIGPYSYGRSDAAGIRKDQVLRDRGAAVTGEARDALRAWLVGEPAGLMPSQRWNALREAVRHLADVDVLGRAGERRVLTRLDVLRALLLAAVLVAAVAIPTLTVPDTVLATLATVVTVTARGEAEGSLTIFPGQAPSTAATSSAIYSRLGATDAAELDIGVLDLVLRSTVVVPRSVWRRPLDALASGAA